MQVKEDTDLMFLKVLFLSYFYVVPAGTDLDNAPEVAVSRQLQPLPLRPGFDGHEPLAQGGSPVVGAKAWRVSLWDHQPVEEPGTDEVKELREELDGEGRVDPAAA